MSLYRPPTLEEQKRADAESATTLLERERVLKGHSIQDAAKAIGVSVDRFRALESGCANHVTNVEKIAIRKYAHLDPALALSQNTVENRAKSGFAARF